MYLSYDEYIQGGGAELGASFSRLEYRSSQVINAYTFGRLKNFDVQPEETKTAVKMCAAEIITVLAAAEGGKVSSWSNDNVSVSYAGSSAEDDMNNIRRIVFDYLSGCVDYNGVNLLFCGGLA